MAPELTAGFLTAEQAQQMNAAMQAFANATSSGLQKVQKKDDTFPASVTSGAAGLHAWTEQTYAADGTRYTLPNGRTGTATYLPARMPDGSTLSSFPVAVTLRKAIRSETLGDVYEIVNVASGGFSGSSGLIDSSAVYYQYTWHSGFAETWTRFGNSQALPAITVGGSYILQVYLAGSLSYAIVSDQLAVYVTLDKPASGVTIYGPGFVAGVKDDPAFAVGSAVGYGYRIHQVPTNSSTSSAGTTSGTATWYIQITTPPYTPSLLIKGSNRFLGDVAVAIWNQVTNEQSYSLVKVG